MSELLEVAIVGAGLSGLALAERLSADGRAVGVFEARDRCGGRILSVPLADNLTVDLGPTWLWPGSQPRIAALCRRLGLTLFRQADAGQSLYKISADTLPVGYHDRQTHADAWRIQGGCAALIDALLAKLADIDIRLNQALLRIVDRDDHVELSFSTVNGTDIVRAKRAVLTVPPRLMAERIAFVPALSADLFEACRATPTWMAGHAKAAVAYPSAFWRQQGWSGNAVLPYPGAILSEIYDAEDPRGEFGALFGFFGIPAEFRDRYRAQLPGLLTHHLSELYGPGAAEPLRSTIQDWSMEAYTATALDRLPPIGHPDYGHRWLQLDHWTDKLYFGGTETAAEHGGYLEGALVAAERVYAALT
ncbi:flavin monoamine oxidase family protein [Methylomonas sp. CM2]|uniref:flavin monoamine oxidase family protein n=1 Tax=Methylomonas sp. CM2 TaxID=3417647 RepID=UPI003CF5B2A5